MPGHIPSGRRAGLQSHLMVNRDMNDSAGSVGRQRKVLIVSNPLNHEGGVANYYKILFENFRSEDFVLSHHESGSRMQFFYFKKTKIILYPFFFIFDLVKFINRLCSDSSISVVQVNPSLIPVPVIRDALYILVAKLFKKKVIVFFRGWKYSFYNVIASNIMLRHLFLSVYQQADSVLVLGTRFKNDLKKLNFRSPQEVQVTTTMVDPKLVTVPIEHNIGRCRILFLGRISQRKGVDDFIEALRLLKRRNLEFVVEIVGHEESAGYVSKAQALLNHFGLQDDVRFLGPCYGDSKVKAFERNDIFVLPSWSEGCPNSVLEALTSGMFVVGTDVGAMRDVIEPGVNGSISEPKLSKI